jgi:RNA polymerase sigma-70 factor (ECF subfamily)
MTFMTNTSIPRLTTWFREDSVAVSDRNASGGDPVPDEAPSAPSFESAVHEVGPAVMARAVRGDDHAFATVISHYDGLLRGFTCQFLGDSSHMDEVLTETFVRAYRLLPAYRAETRPSTWLFKIVYNACMAASEETVATDADTEVAPHPEPSEGDASGRGQLALWLDEAVAQLPPQPRAAVLLIDAVGLDPASAAEVLDISVDQLAEFLAGARPDLRAVVAAGGEGRRP